MSVSKSWTQEEHELLRTNKHLTVKEIIQIMPWRSESAINHKLSRLGIGKGVSVSNADRARKFQISQTEEFGWLIGAYLGDGFVTHKIPIIGITSIDIEIVERFRSSVATASCDESIMRIPIKLLKRNDKWSKKDSYGIRIGAANLGRWLKDVSANKSRIPEIVYSNREISLGFLSAMIDTEGCLFNSQNTTACYVGMKDKPLIEHMSALFNSLGIKTGIVRYNGSGAWCFSINMKNLCMSGIKLTCKRKQEKMENYTRKHLTTDCGYKTLCYKGQIGEHTGDTEEEVLDAA